jgi:hypothetical protein
LFCGLYHPITTAWKGRDVRIVFDSDVMTKPQVQAALRTLTQVLQAKGSHVTAVYLPPDKEGGKQGVDDYLAHGRTVADLERLVTAPRPAPKAAQARVTLLDDEPEVMRQPIALIDGRAYAALWASVEVEMTETTTSSGDIRRHDPPIVLHERRLFVVRDDGRVFGEGADAPLEDRGGEHAAVPAGVEEARLTQPAGLAVSGANGT